MVLEEISIELLSIYTVDRFLVVGGEGLPYPWTRFLSVILPRHRCDSTLLLYEASSKMIFNCSKLEEEKKNHL